MILPHRLHEVAAFSGLDVGAAGNGAVSLQVEGTLDMTVAPP
jgi:hypothetical protein